MIDDDWLVDRIVKMFVYYDVVDLIRDLSMYNIFAYSLSVCHGNCVTSKPTYVRFSYFIILPINNVIVAFFS